jgi:nitrogen-specific signal transduction histidine kinase/ActR/RegA family two-component response regulator
VFGDVTEATKNQERLRQIEKMELIGRLAGGVAHDLNNLITPLLGYSEILLVNLDPDNPQYTTVDSIRRAAEEARRLTEQLLSFGRRQVVDEKVLDIHTILSECEDIIRHSLREDIDIRFELQASSSWVKVDVNQIKQALINLALNAQESMPDGGSILIKTDSVDIDSSKLSHYPGLAAGEFVTISISDTGLGMDKRQLEHLFEPYFLHPTGSEGTGLGLASVYGILRRHQGLITADSNLGQGSCFTMMLPAADSAESPVESPTTERKGPKGSETIVVVEDDLLVRELTSRILREHGYTVYDADLPSKCLELFDEIGQGVVLLVADVVMPEMNGRELYETLSQKHPTLKVLYMSGYTDRVIARHGVLEQGVNLLQKPFSLVALANKVRAVLDDE